MGNDALHGGQSGGEYLSEAKRASPQRIRTVPSEGERSSEGVYVDINEVMNFMSPSPKVFNHFRSLSFDKVESKLSPSRKSFTTGEEQLKRSHSLDSFDPLKLSPVASAEQSPCRPLNEPPAIERKVREGSEIHVSHFVDEKEPKVLATIKIESAEEASLELQKRKETQRVLLERYRHTLKTAQRDGASNHMEDSESSSPNDRISTWSIPQEHADVTDSNDRTSGMTPNALAQFRQEPEFHAAIYDDDTNTLHGTENVLSIDGTHNHSSEELLERADATHVETNMASTLDAAGHEAANASSSENLGAMTDQLSLTGEDAARKHESTFLIDSAMNSGESKNGEPVDFVTRDLDFAPNNTIDAMFEIGEVDDAYPDAVFEIGDDDDSDHDDIAEASNTNTEQAFGRAVSPSPQDEPMDKALPTSLETESINIVDEKWSQPDVDGRVASDDNGHSMVLLSSRSEHNRAIPVGESSIPLPEHEERQVASNEEVCMSNLVQNNNRTEPVPFGSEVQAIHSRTTMTVHTTDLQTSSVNETNTRTESVVALQNENFVKVGSASDESNARNFPYPPVLIERGEILDTLSDVKVEGEEVRNYLISDGSTHSGDDASHLPTGFPLERQDNQSKLQDVSSEVHPLPTEVLDAEAYSSVIETYTSANRQLDESHSTPNFGAQQIPLNTNENDSGMNRGDNFVDNSNGYDEVDFIPDEVLNLTLAPGESPSGVVALVDYTQVAPDSTVRESIEARQSQSLQEQIDLRQPESIELNEGERSSEQANSVIDHAEDFSASDNFDARANSALIGEIDVPSLDGSAAVPGLGRSETLKEILKTDSDPINVMSHPVDGEGDTVARSGISSACPSDEGLDIDDVDGNSRVKEVAPGGDGASSSGMRSTYPSDEGLDKSAFGIDMADTSESEFDAQALLRSDNFGMENAKRSVPMSLGFDGLAASDLPSDDTKHLLHGTNHDELGTASPLVVDANRVDQVAEQLYPMEVAEGAFADEIDTHGVDLLKTDGDLAPNADYMADFDALVSDAENELMALLGALPHDTTDEHNVPVSTAAAYSQSPTLSKKDRLIITMSSGMNEESENVGETSVGKLIESQVAPLTSDNLASSYPSIPNPALENQSGVSTLVVEDNKVHVIRKGNESVGEKSTTISSPLTRNSVLHPQTTYSQKDKPACIDTPELSDVGIPSALEYESSEKGKISESLPQSSEHNIRMHSSSVNECATDGLPAMRDEVNLGDKGKPSETIARLQTVEIPNRNQTEHVDLRLRAANPESAVLDPLLGPDELQSRIAQVSSALPTKSQKSDSAVNDHPQSPNSVSDSQSSYSRGHDVKRLDSSLSASRGQFYDQGSTFGNKSTLSSMSSTISPGSTVRGLLSSGIVTPANAEELLLLLQGSMLGPASEKTASNPNRPPLFPRKKDYDPSVLVELLSAKLRGQVPTAAQNISMHKPETRWMKHSSAAFATKESVFAPRTDASSLSPPGSPPEPIYDETLERDSSDTSENDSQISEFPVSSLEEVSTWDMINEPTSDSVSDVRKSHKPTFVVMPELDSPLFRQVPREFDWGDSSYAAELPSPRIEGIPTDDLRGDSSHRSISRGRRGRVRRLSLSSKGSSRKSASSKGMMRLKVPKPAVPPDIRMVRSEEMGTTKSSPVSSGGNDLPHVFQSNVGNQMSERNRHHQFLQLQKSASVPNLFRRNKTPSRKREKLSTVVSTEKDIISPQGSTAVNIELSFDSVALQGFSSGTVRNIEDSSAYKHVLSPHLTLRESLYMPSDQRSRDGLQLDDDLLSFASVRPALFPTQCGELHASIKYMCSKRWEQLLACWKHEHVLRVMNTRRCSPHFFRESNICGRNSPTVRSPDSAVRERAFELHLRGLKFPGYSILSDMKNLDGFSPNHGENLTYALSRFLPEIEDMCTMNQAQLMHENCDTTPTALVQEATDIFEGFKSLIADSVETLESEISWSSSRIRFDVCMKDLESIMLKAARKYDSNVARVKDILRARIIFPTEADLVCWLVNMRNKIKDWPCTSPIKSLDIVRVKNLFRSQSPLGGFQRCSLPTGYRHVLINLQLNKSFLAEVQLNLSDLFDVLGEAGGSLHLAICDVDAALLKVAQVNAVQSFSSEIAGIISRFVGEWGGASEKPIYRQRNMSDVSQKMRRSMHDDAVTPVRQNLSSVSSPRDIEQLYVPDLIDGKRRSDVEEKDTDSTATRTGPEESLIVESMETVLVSKETATKHVNGDDVSEIPRLPRDDSREQDASQPSINTSSILESLPSDISRVDGDLLLLGVFEAARIHLEEQPRDIAALCCLSTILDFIGDNNLKRRYFHPAMDNFKVGLIKQSLSLCQQSISSGMTGWVENGTDDKQHFASRLLSLLHTLSLAFAEKKQWKDARKVLETLVLTCQQRLPLYHPTTLSSMFDLARMAQKLGDNRFAMSMVARVACRASLYLAEMEDKSLSHLEQCLSDRTSRVPVFRIDTNRDAVFMLHAFVSSLKDHISMKRGTVFEEHEEINLLEEHLFADAVAVLANCVKAHGVILGNSDGSTFYWSLAASHYQRLFDRFSQLRGLGAVPTLSIARGLARCLRELGKGVHALEFLGKLVAACEKSLKREIVGTSHAPIPKEEPGVRFLKRNHSSGETGNDVAMRISLALCYWQMAVLTTDCHPTEKGRVEALNLLRSASLALREAYPKIPETDEATKELCADALQKVEEEAKAIFLPMSVD